ncbi:hybrid sensor histidine kinase/response regulator [Ktedonospora formicarum]|uniref:histidine kinase n=1 Tax=Ktedonospora formicarum TaxID=2778364 RepID=A0A8J3MPX7_9CHLR|nr:hybrid sensor histidine kinase/response regulator [Ktedonospora formicarum]GHO43360.1 hybrid sensor histidine kinase/response regulator [Ktedonospora formicarum]
MTTPTILIVDDDAALLKALPQTLYLRMGDNIKVDTCDAAERALTMIQEHDYDAIVSDIKMPGMDGLELLSRVRELRPETPTLLITGHGEYDLAIRALRGGAYDYILKPIDRDSFVAALQRAIQAYQLRRQVMEQHIELSQHARSLEWLVQKRTSELANANEAKDKFLRIVSHELKTPLSGLKDMAQFLRNQLDHEVDTQVLRQGFEDMEHVISRTEILVRDLLDTSMMESNMFVLHRKRVNLVSLCQRVLNEYTAGGIARLASEIVAESIEVDVDSDRICQVLVNLLSNAHKYSGPDAPITIRLQQSGYEAMMMLEDQGMGIPEEEQKRIFEQFYRVPIGSKQSGEQQGSGLGLYIARKIMERHSGRLDVQSVQGNGSTFTCVLPVSIDPDFADEGSYHLEHRTLATWTVVYSS